MSRELKFRVWDSKTRVFGGPGGLMRSEDPEYSVPYVCLEAFNDFSKIPEGTWRERFVVEQFTGLKDRNGDEIYEGDVVRRWRHRAESDQYGAPKDYEPSLGQVEYVVNWGRFRIKGPGVLPAKDWEADLHDGLSFWSDQSYICLEIEGNIHQNPELLSS